ncbi:MAG TPA: hypothetical protein VLL48_00325 [Longimicrobiales bacterium]|nr:hypothetical protein [Longimicrobiales bacterium]
MVREHTRVHRRTLAAGVAASAALHAAVLAWASFAVPGPAEPEPAIRPPGPEPAFEIVRVVEGPAATPAPAAPEVEARAGGEGTPAGEAPEAAPPSPDDAAAPEAVPAEPEAEHRARPVVAARRDLRARLSPTALAVEAPEPSPEDARWAEARARREAEREAAEAAERAARARAAAAARADADGEDGAAREGEDEGGWGLGDLFRGISVTISGGGTCLPDLIDGVPSPGVTSVNDRNPLTPSMGGGVLGASGPSQPVTSVGRPGGLDRPGGMGGTGVGVVRR